MFGDCHFGDRHDKHLITTWLVEMLVNLNLISRSTKYGSDSVPVQQLFDGYTPDSVKLSWRLFYYEYKGPSSSEMQPFISMNCPKKRNVEVWRRLITDILRNLHLWHVHTAREEE